MIYSAMIVQELDGTTTSFVKLLHHMLGARPLTQQRPCIIIMLAVLAPAGFS